MIEVKNLKKTFDEVRAVNGISLSIKEGEVFGLVGTNGAGKSTLLRLMAGILKPEEGCVLVDGEEIYDNPGKKAGLFFVPDDTYYFPNATTEEMLHYYAGLYAGFDTKRFGVLSEQFHLEAKRRISTFSKGMKKQLFLLYGLCAGTKYLFCDETFDGLDPVMRQAAKSLLAHDMDERGLTPVLTSHNLRELEDICDYVGLLHQGGVILSRELSEMKHNLLRIQVVFNDENEQKRAEEKMQFILHRQSGRVHTYTVRSSAAELEMTFSDIGTVLFETLPLSLEEIFISETEVIGYDIQKIILG